MTMGLAEGNERLLAWSSKLNSIKFAKAFFAERWFDDCLNHCRWYGAGFSYTFSEQLITMFRYLLIRLIYIVKTLNTIYVW